MTPSMSASSRMSLGMPPWLCPRSTTIELGGSRRTRATRKSCRLLGKQPSEEPAAIDGWTRAAPLLRTLGMWKTDLLSVGEMIMRAVIYARYSSELQSDASIEDQIRACGRSQQGMRTDPCGL